jgi:hypothetical protein
MVESVASAAVVPSHKATAARQRVRSRFFLVMSILMLAIVSPGLVARSFSVHFSTCVRSRHIYSYMVRFLPLGTYGSSFKRGA